MKVFAAVCQNLLNANEYLTNTVSLGVSKDGTASNVLLLRVVTVW